MTVIAEERAIPFELKNPGPLDASYGPYADLATAKLAIDPLLRAYKTVGVLTASGIIEYWWKNGIADSDLVLKDVGGLGGDNSGLETRVTNIETVLPNLATDAEVATAITNYDTNLKTGLPDGTTLSDIYNRSSNTVIEISVANIASRNLLNVQRLPTIAFVADDGDGKWAKYQATTTGVSSTWTKVGDQDGLGGSSLTAAQVKTLYESNADTNAFTDADSAKLTGLVQGVTLTTQIGTLPTGANTAIIATNPLNQALSNLQVQINNKANTSSTPATSATFTTAQIRTTTVALPTLVYVAESGKYRFYYYDSTDTTTADNGGNVIVATGTNNVGKRFKLVHDFVIPMSLYGIKGDNIADDTNLVNSAISTMPSGYTFLVSGKCKVTDTINFASKKITVKGVNETDGFYGFATATTDKTTSNLVNIVSITGGQNSNVTFENMTISGQGLDIRLGILATGRFHFKNLHIQDIGSRNVKDVDGLRFGSGCDKSTSKFLYINNIMGNNYFESDAAASATVRGIRMYSSTATTAPQDCYFEDTYIDNVYQVYANEGYKESTDTGAPLVTPYEMMGVNFTLPAAANATNGAIMDADALVVQSSSVSNPEDFNVTFNRIYCSRYLKRAMKFQCGGVTVESPECIASGSFSTTTIIGVMGPNIKINNAYLDGDCTYVFEAQDCDNFVCTNSRRLRTTHGSGYVFRFVQRYSLNADGIKGVTIVNNKGIEAQSGFRANLAGAPVSSLSYMMLTDCEIDQNTFTLTANSHLWEDDPRLNNVRVTNNTFRGTNAAIAFTHLQYRNSHAGGLILDNNSFPDMTTAYPVSLVDDILVYKGTKALLDTPSQNSNKNWEVGDKIYSSDAITGKTDIGWQIISAGTNATISTTCTTVAGSPVITVASMTNIFAGAYIKVGSVNAKVLSIETYTRKVTLNVTMAAAATLVSVNNIRAAYQPLFDGPFTNTATSVTRATLNSTYANTGVGQLVYFPSYTGGPRVYVKVAASDWIWYNGTLAV